MCICRKIKTIVEIVFICFGLRDEYEKRKEEKKIPSQLQRIIEIFFKNVVLSFRCADLRSKAHQKRPS